jgi:hypothetical protein
MRKFSNFVEFENAINCFIEGYWNTLIEGNPNPENWKRSIKNGFKQMFKNNYVESLPTDEQLNVCTDILNGFYHIESFKDSETGFKMEVQTELRIQTCAIFAYIGLI